MLYNTLKFLHILLTILAVGFSMTFGLILSRAEKADKDGRELKYALTDRAADEHDRERLLRAPRASSALVWSSSAAYSGRRCGFTDRRRSS